MRKVRILKRAVTLIEMIVVMILIATITGAVTLNYRKSLNEGRAFRTKEGIDRIETMLSLYFAEHPDANKNVSEYSELLNIAANSPLVKNAKDFLQDGWGSNYDISCKENGSDFEILVVSPKYEQYKKEKEHKSPSK
jgi:prepilin-type N-terminal cleavage/methylation domain-containing protein